MASCFPKNTGPFHVGYIDILTKADDIPKSFHPTNLVKLNLGCLVRLFYPADKESACGSPPAKWLPEPHQELYGYGLGKQANIRLPFVGWFSYYYARNILCNAFKWPALISQSIWKENQTCDCYKKKDKLPVVIFSHGLKAERNVYTSFCAQLASEGFLVAAVEHRDASALSTFIYDENGKAIEIPFCNIDGEEEPMKIRTVQLQQRTCEVSNVVTLLSKLNENPDQINNLLENGDFDIQSFKNRIDMNTIAVMGHSFGGATATKALKDDHRLKCGFGLDVWFEPLESEFYSFPENYRKSNFLITTEYFNWRKNLKLYYQYEDTLPKKEFVEHLTLRATMHYDQADIPMILPRYMNSRITKHFGRRLSFEEAIAKQRKMIRDFFCKFHSTTSSAEGTPVELLKDGYILDEEFIVGSNIPFDKNYKKPTEEVNQNAVASNL